jgi:hypothetical protein
VTSLLSGYSIAEAGSDLLPLLSRERRESIPEGDMAARLGGVFQASPWTADLTSASSFVRSRRVDVLRERLPSCVPDNAALCQPLHAKHQPSQPVGFVGSE